MFLIAEHFSSPSFFYSVSDDLRGLRSSRQHKFKKRNERFIQPVLPHSRQDVRLCQFFLNLIGSYVIPWLPDETMSFPSVYVPSQGPTMNISELEGAADQGLDAHPHTYTVFGLDNLFFCKKPHWGWGCSSVVEHLPSMCKGLDSL